MNVHCAARSYGDTTMCASCGLQWDTKDPEPPECGKMSPGRTDTLTMAIVPPMATAKDIDEAMRRSGADAIGAFQGFNFISLAEGNPNGSREAIVVHRTATGELIAGEVSKPGKFLTDEQWTALRRACGEKA